MSNGWLRYFLDSNKLIFSLLFLFFFFFLSLAFVLTTKMERRLFFFPSIAGAALETEWHYLPVRWNKEEELRLFVAEFILGPKKMSARPLLSANVGLRSVILGEDNILYVNFDEKMVFPENQNKMPLETVFSIIEKNIIHNFSYVEDVVITINGELLK